MCGINGFTFKNPNLIEKMSAVTRHRGPDQTAVWCGEGISLGFNRLAIIDLSERGNQPMWDAAREVVIIFNGEIYNFQDLRQELEAKYSFQSHSDTEVILYAYKEWGEECVKKLNGIFAFAVWDTRTQKLFIARDRCGVKPLYYYYDNQQLIFSSEIKAILEHPISRAVDMGAFNLYCQILYVPEPDTMFRGVKKLPAASFLSLQGGTLSIKKYWEVTDFSNLSSRPEAVSNIQELFKDSVKRQLVSDRPLGIFLSGGIDSTAVLGAAKEYTTGAVKTYSVGFAVKPGQEKFNADFLLARQTAKHFQTDHHELMINAKDIGDNLEKIAWHLDEPNFNATAGAAYLLAQEAKKTVTVVLGGDGGDELFGGYPRYYYSRLLSYFQAIPGFLQYVIKTGVKVAGKPGLAAKLSIGANAERVWAALAQKSVPQELVNKNIFEPNAALNYFNERFFSSHNSLYPSLNSHNSHPDFEKHFMHLDRQSWLVDESLARTDKMTMAWGLEERVPILDHRLVELASRIPTKWKMHVLGQHGKNFQGKDIWVDAMRGYLPPHVLHEQKRGWFTPMAKWVRDELYSQVDEILAPSNINAEFFNPVAVQNVWQNHVSGKQYNLNIIWAIVMWHLWYKQFIK